MATAILIGGPNGAGKTTFARQLLPVVYPHAMFLNVDEIHREDPAFSTLISAGRELLRRLSVFEQAGRSFAIETTLSSNMYARHIPRWKARGYETSLHFIELSSADYAVERVRQRVLAGGHTVPEADVRRRFARGLRLLPLYKPLVDEWYHWQSDDTGLRLVDHERP